MSRIVLALVLCMLCVQLAGCAVLAKDRRDTSWDPKGEHLLFEQIPNWEGGANQVCGGQVRESDLRGRSPRC